jgi:hypothetical protein
MKQPNCTYIVASQWSLPIDCDDCPFVANASRNCAILKAFIQIWGRWHLYPNTKKGTSHPGTSHALWEHCAVLCTVQNDLRTSVTVESTAVSTEYHTTIILGFHATYSTTIYGALHLLQHCMYKRILSLHYSSIDMHSLPVQFSSTVQYIHTVFSNFLKSEISP